MSEASMSKSEVERIFGLPKEEQIEAMADWLSRLFSETLEEENERLKARVIELEGEVAHLKRVIGGQSRFPKMGGSE